MEGHAFATLTPTNALAKLAFSDVFDAMTRGHQGPLTDAAANHMSVEPEQEYDADVLRFRRETEVSASEGDFSVSLTEPDTDSQPDMRHMGMIWKGHYVLSVHSSPYEAQMGWIVGKGTNQDISLCTDAFAKRHNLNIRGRHARFNFDRQNLAFFMARITNSSLAEIAVNGEAVGRHIYALNQHSMNIWMNSLEYNFHYTGFSLTEDFLVRRRNYSRNAMRISRSIGFEMPTPRRHTRVIGQWTLNRPLGKGIAGRVFLASNSKNDVVAVKIMERTARSESVVDKEVATCRALTALARRLDDGGRIVHLTETIDPREEVSASSTAFEEVALVLQPMTPETLDDLVGNRSMGGPRGMSIEAATVFRDVLLGLKFLHDHGWVHRDIKPQNIGILPGNPPRAVILDLGQAEVLKSGSMISATPGQGGTINYLAPEREMSEYDHAVDVWSMGVIGYELIYGHHPFRFTVNPWQAEERYKALRPVFDNHYQRAINNLLNDYGLYAEQKAAKRDPNFIHLGDLLAQMLSHEWAPNSRNRARRINATEALQHPAWDPLLSDSPESKRLRMS